MTWTRKGTVDCREPLTNAVAPDLIAFIGADGLQPDGTFEPFDTAPPAVAIDLLSFGPDEDGWGVIIAVVTELVEGPATMNVRMFPTADTEDVSNMVSCRYGEDGDAVDQVCQDFASGIPVPLRAADIDGNAFSQTLPLKVVNGELVVDLDPSETSDDATVEVVVVSLQVGPVGASYLINANALVEAWFAV